MDSCWCLYVWLELRMHAPIPLWDCLTPGLDPVAWRLSLKSVSPCSHAQQEGCQPEPERLQPLRPGALGSPSAQTIANVGGCRRIYTGSILAPPYPTPQHQDSLIQALNEQMTAVLPSWSRARFSWGLPEVLRKEMRDPWKRLLCLGPSERSHNKQGQKEYYTLNLRVKSSPLYL